MQVVQQMLQAKIAKADALQAGMTELQEQLEDQDEKMTQLWDELLALRAYKAAHPE